MSQPKDINAWQKKAEAAEKTVNILKHKVIELYNAGAQSVIHRQMEKARQRDEENRRKREIMEVRNQELKKYSETLEQQVESRTETIKTILNHVTFGFLVVDRNMVIHDEYTRSCQTLFGQTKLGGLTIVQALKMNKRAAEHYGLCMDQVFEDIMPSTVTLSQMPERFEINGRILRCEPSIIRKNGKVDRILYTISDISQLEAAQREAQTNRILVGILRRREGFQEYMTEVKEQIHQALGLAQAKNQETVRRILHTIKGNAASWGLVDIASVVHGIEDEHTITKAHVQQVEEAFRSFINTHAQIIGFEYEGLHEVNFEVSSTQIERLKTLISDLPGNQASRLQTWTAVVLQKPASLLLGPTEEFVAKLSHRLGKDVRFVTKGLDTLVDVDTMRGVLQGVMHLIRNSIDHGIEEEGMRGSKNATGRIEFTIDCKDNHYQVIVKDDGRGIDVGKLKKKAVALGLKTQQEIDRMSPQEQLELIFLDGLSSADTTTEISGRGVGMSSILAAVRRVHGRFHIESRFGEGSTMRLEVPVPESLRVPLKDVA
ncbi:ATP-binding protein [Oligoflexus tunisiensis]|uniref:ATP-binding protein n=1 Tax=Oligoflexus tunisiensis TaxID=708132 RepID=UPI000A494D02|nr:ATP-binding protein [Oligoflexus tunisiensis]